MINISLSYYYDINNYGNEEGVSLEEGVSSRTFRKIVVRADKRNSRLLIYLQSW